LYNEKKDGSKVEVFEFGLCSALIFTIMQILYCPACPVKHTCTILPCKGISCVVLHFLHYLALRGNVLRCPALSCTILHCEVMSCVALHCPALSCIARGCPALSYTVLHYLALRGDVLRCPTLSCTVLNCKGMSCVVLQYIVLH
jgi:hypothetical protein